MYSSAYLLGCSIARCLSGYNRKGWSPTPFCTFSTGVPTFSKLCCPDLEQQTGAQQVFFCSQICLCAFADDEDFEGEEGGLVIKGTL